MSADGLVVDGDILVGRTSAFTTAMLELQNDETLQVALNNNNTDGQMLSLYNSGNLVGGLGNSVQDLNIYRGSNVAVSIANNGDVQFYEDTGTTAKMVWDASAESLGIGTSSPSANLDVEGAVPVIRLSDTDISSSWSDNKEMGRLEFYTTDGSGNAPYDTAYISAVNGFSGGTLPSGELVFATATYNASGGAVERMRIDDEGNVGIGTDSPSSIGTNIPTLELGGGVTDRSGGVSFASSDSSQKASAYIAGGAFVLGSVTSQPITFRTNNTERARIDSSGNLLVGTTSALGPLSSGGAGVSLRPDGNVYIGSSTQPLSLNVSNDGVISKFYKNGSTVGSIGYSASGLYIDGEAGHSGIQFAGNNWLPRDSGAAVDNLIDIGVSSLRFDDVYATNGTIQTSDRNEKQDIEVLSDAEQRVAQACKGLLRKFRWKDSVAEKGDELVFTLVLLHKTYEDAFDSRGFGRRSIRYVHSAQRGMKKEISVDAVEAQEEVLDEDGNVVTEAVEAKDAYTYTDTKDEPKDGYTERTFRCSLP